MYIWLSLLLLLLVCWLFAVNSRTQDREATEALAALERKLHVLVAHLQKTHPGDPRTQRLSYNWDGRVTLLKNPGAGMTTDKKHIGVCVRSASGQLEDSTTGAFVGIHEASHVCSESTGHTQEFWDNMRWLLKEAVACGVYDHEDFEANPKSYCGTVISHSPLTCVLKGTCS